MVASSKPGYRWYILTLATLTHTFAVAMPFMAMPVLFNEIAADLRLNLVEIGIVWGMSPLAGMFVAVIGGLLGDRFGVKRVLAVACFLAGLAGALRGLSGGFISLAATMFLFGLLEAIIPLNVHKTASIWFPGRYFATANGVLSMGMAVGFTTGSMISAVVLSPLLGSWRNVLFLYGALSIVISVLWAISREKPGQVEAMAGDTGMIPFRQALSRVVRNRGVWLLGFIVLGNIGSTQGMIGYLPLYLRQSGWTAASADGTLAAFNAASMVAAIPLAFLSDKLGSRKWVLLTGMIVTAIGIGLLSVAGGIVVWVLAIMIGVFRDGFFAVLMTTIMETKGIGAAYAGTALGLALTLSRLGGVFSPPLGNGLAHLNPGSPFIFWASLAAVTSLGFFFMKER